MGAQPYDGFAPWFDAWQRAFGPAYDALILERVTAMLPRPPARVADLGGGTGDLVVALAARGYDVVGVDRSAPMLAIARAKAAAAGVRASFVEQDLRTLSLAVPLDAAVCVYTVLNQLTGDDDLDRAFAAVRDALVPGGSFVFELNLPATYARWWTGTETVVLADATVTRTHGLDTDGRTIAADVTITPHDGRPVVRDRILQRARSDDEVHDALARAGLRVQAIERFNPFAPDEPPMKALWRAHRART